MLQQTPDTRQILLMSPQALVQLLQQQPRLQKELLRRCNSAYWAPRTPVQTPQAAIAWLGYNTVKNLVLELQG